MGLMNVYRAFVVQWLKGRVELSVLVTCTREIDFILYTSKQMVMRLRWDLIILLSQQTEGPECWLCNKTHVTVHSTTSLTSSSSRRSHTRWMADVCCGNTNMAVVALTRSLSQHSTTGQITSYQPIKEVTTVNIGWNKRYFCKTPCG